jgi:hypothetical protein
MREDVDSRRTLAMARSRVLVRAVEGARPTETERRAPTERTLPASEERSSDLARRRFCSSMRRLYSLARCSTDDRLLCVDLYDVIETETSSLCSDTSALFFSSMRKPLGFILEVWRLLYECGLIQNTRRCDQDAIMMIND